MALLNQFGKITNTSFGVWVLEQNARMVFFRQINFFKVRHYDSYAHCTVK